MGCSSSSQQVAQPEREDPFSLVTEAHCVAIGEEEAVLEECTGSCAIAAGSDKTGLGVVLDAEVEADASADSRIVAQVASTQEEEDEKEEISNSHNNTTMEELKNDDDDEVRVETMENAPLTIETAQAVELDMDAVTSSSSDAAPCSTALQFLDLEEVKELTLTHLKVSCSVGVDFFLHTASSLRTLPLELFQLGNVETNVGVVFKGAFPPQTLDLAQQTLVTLEIFNVKDFDLFALKVAFSAAQRSLRCVKVTSCDSMRMQSIQEEHQLLLSETFSQVPTCVEELSLLYSIELSDQVLELLSPPLKSLDSLRRFTASRLVSNSQPLQHTVPPCSLACSGSGQASGFGLQLESSNELHEAKTKPFQVPRLTHAAWAAFKTAYPVARMRIDALSIETLGDSSGTTTTGTNPFAADALLPALDKGVFGVEADHDGVGRCICIA